MSPIQLQPGCFYGNLRSSFKVCELGLAEIIYPAKQRTLEHSHELAYFSLTLNGTYTKFYGVQRVECAPQTLIFHPPHQKQSGRCGEAGGRAFLVEIGPRLFEHLNRHPVITDRLAVFRNGPLIRSAIRLYKEFRQMDALSPLTIEGLLLEMLAEASRHVRNVPPDKRPLWLEQAREIINASFSYDLTIPSIAESVGVHPVYLAAEFRRIYQTTIGEYKRKLRVDFACREIARTDAPLVQIALESGFSNQSQFCTTFKRVTGMTPAAYRAILRSP
jgi:AraC family transcriptional regulator